MNNTMYSFPDGKLEIDCLTGSPLSERSAFSYYIKCMRKCSSGACDSCPYPLPSTGVESCCHKMLSDASDFFSCHLPNEVSLSDGSAKWKYEDALSHYVSDLSDEMPVVAEAISTLESYFSCLPEDALLHHSRVLAVAYLALIDVQRSNGISPSGK